MNIAYEKVNRFEVAVRSRAISRLITTALRGLIKNGAHDEIRAGASVTEVC